MLRRGKDIFVGAPEPKAKYAHFLEKFARRPEHYPATWDHFSLDETSGITKLTRVLREDWYMIDPFSDRIDGGMVAADRYKILHTAVA